MDTLDPLLLNSIAKSREVIVYDSSGIRHSEGTVPDSISKMVAILVDLLAALEIPKANFIGFSMGVALPPREVLESAGANSDQPPTEEDMMKLFFYPSETCLALGHAWWKQIHERNVQGEPRKAYLTGSGAESQLAAIFDFNTDTSTFDRLTDIKAPVLVTNGHKDIMSPTSNSFVLQQEIPNAQLHLYPDAGHGHLFQVPELYAKHLDLFLNH